MDIPKSPIFESNSLRDTTEANINRLTSAVDNVMKSNPATLDDIARPVYGKDFDDLDGKVQRDCVFGLMRREFSPRVAVLLEILAASQIAGNVRQQLDSVLQAGSDDEFINAAIKALKNAA